MTDAGHLYIIDGDIMRLACDAWLLPTDLHFNVTAAFYGALGMERAGPLAGRSSVDWSGQGCILHEAATGDRPDLWLGDIGGDEHTPISHFTQRADEFVSRASAVARPRLEEAGRRPILAITAIGTGRGGKRGQRGHLLKALVPTLIRAAERERCDIVLVAFGSVMYAAAQSARRSIEGATVDPWGSLTTTLRAQAEALAQRAEQGQLVLFMGAGVSRDAGIPVWRDLLQDLARRLGRNDQWLEMVKDLDPRDQASLLHEPAPKVFNAAVDEVMNKERYSLMHGLLASLPVNENVTTNFDTLFEHAAETDGRQLSVIPSADKTPGKRWLLKLHGTIGDSDNRVFTRGEYLGAMSAHTALRGLVQAMLLTRYMMFVGYSLKDEDFHHLVHDVRSALPKSAPPQPSPATGDVDAPESVSTDGAVPSATPRRLGIVLSPSAPSPAEALWPELDFLSFGADDRGRALEIGEAARQLTIFLDFVGSRAASEVKFVADDSLGALRTEQELALADVVERLEQLLQHAPDDGWREVRQFVAHFRPPTDSGVIRQDDAIAPELVAHHDRRMQAHRIASAFTTANRRNWVEGPSTCAIAEDAMEFSAIQPVETKPFLASRRDLLTGDALGHSATITAIDASEHQGAEDLTVPAVSTIVA